MAFRVLPLFCPSQTLRPLFLTASSSEMPCLPPPPRRPCEARWPPRLLPGHWTPIGVPLLPRGPHTLKGLLHTGCWTLPKADPGVGVGAWSEQALSPESLAQVRVELPAHLPPGHPQHTPQDRAQLPAQQPCSQRPSHEPGAPPPRGLRDGFLWDQCSHYTAFPPLLRGPIGISHRVLGCWQMALGT